MKLIESSVEYLPQQPGMEGLYKQIEIAGRTCYKSEDKITSDSAEKFVHKMMENHHNAMLEHGTVYLKMPVTCRTGYRIDCYHDNPYSKVKIKEREHEKLVFDYYITTNLRVLTEHEWPDDLKYICEPTKHHEKRISLKLITSIGIVRELIRHRVFSFANESTRYCNYSKDKFNNELTFIIPSWADIPRGTIFIAPERVWTIVPENIPEFIVIPDKPGNLNLLEALARCEFEYNSMIKNGLQPQQAREVLPLCTKSELVMTGFESDWRNLLDKRLFGKTGQPHPDMLVLANLIKQEFEKAGVWDGIMKYPSKYE